MGIYMSIGDTTQIKAQLKSLLTAQYLKHSGGSSPLCRRDTTSVRCIKSDVRNGNTKALNRTSVTKLKRVFLREGSLRWHRALDLTFMLQKH